MALNVFDSVLTAKQIVTLAERKANNPGLHLTPNGVEPVSSTDVNNPMVNAPAYAMLQLILDDLAGTVNFTFKRTALDFYVNARHNALPGNFWRVGFSDPCWIYPTGDETARVRFQLLDAQDFHARAVNGPQGQPEVGYINRESGNLTLDPPPDQQYVVELHYYPWQPALATPASKPWFPYSRYLVSALLRDLYLQQDDTRWQIANAECDTMMKRIKSAMGDERDRASARLDLDPTFYRRPVEL